MASSRGSHNLQRFMEGKQKLSHRALMFCMHHQLIVLNQGCSNYESVANGPTSSSHIFRTGLHRKNIKNVLSETTKPKTVVCVM